MSKEHLEKLMALLARARKSNERTRQLLAKKQTPIEEVKTDNELSAQVRAFQDLLRETRAKRMEFQRRFPDLFGEDLLATPAEKPLTAAA
jgi:hypothetical protein